MIRAEIGTGRLDLLVTAPDSVSPRGQGAEKHDTKGGCSRRPAGCGTIYNPRGWMRASFLALMDASFLSPQRHLDSRDKKRARAVYKREPRDGSPSRRSSADRERHDAEPAREGYDPVTPGQPARDRQESSYQISLKGADHLTPRPTLRLVAVDPKKLFQTRQGSAGPLYRRAMAGLSAASRS